jgi:hypothetical protein
MELVERIVLPEPEAPPDSTPPAAHAAPTPEPAKSEPPREGERPRSAARRLAGQVLSNRIAQFGLIAAALFAVAPRGAAPSRIELAHTTFDKLHGAAAQKKGLVVLPRDEAAAVDQRAVEDEVLFREGVRLGLDQNDGVVRNRVIQKTLFFAEELADASRAATESELRAYFEAHAADFARPGRVRLQHVFATTEAALPPKPADAEGVPGRPLAIGEAGPVPAETSGDERALAEAFGAELGRRLFELPEGKWEGPLKSPFGFHHVKVLAREGSRPARFEEVRGRVIEQLSLERRERAVADFLEKAYGRYQISLDGKPVGAHEVSHRVAVRSVTSGED